MHALEALMCLVDSSAWPSLPPRILCGTVQWPTLLCITIRLPHKGCCNMRRSLLEQFRTEVLTFATWVF